MSHTPGPWCLGFSDREVCDLAICTADASPLDGATIARLVAKKGTEYGNAKLLATAPDLLQEAKTLLATIDSWGGTVNEQHLAGLRAAVQKAESAA